VPFQNFATSDGWIVVACAKHKFWVSLCEAIGLEDLASDQRFVDFAARDANRDALVPILSAAFAERTTDEWLRALAQAGVPSAPVNDLEAALTDVQVEARASVAAVEHPNLGTVRHIASPLRLGHEAPLRSAPARGEHTEDVLSEVCGYSTHHVLELREAGVFGQE
jgi:crotonobetainyl-CoA:carnitine CoA-transferase CaiB-like acyl-CoA transferase